MGTQTPVNGVAAAEVEGDELSDVDAMGDGELNGRDCGQAQQQQQQQVQQPAQQFDSNLAHAMGSFVGR